MDPITPSLEAWDPPAVARERRDHLRSGPELAAEFARLRAEGVDLVAGLDDRADGRATPCPSVL